MLSPDVGVTHVLGLFDGILENFFRARRKWNFAEQHNVVASANNFFDLGAHATEVHAKISQDLRGNAFAKRDEPEQDMLGPYIIVIQPLRLFLGDENNTLGSFSKSVRHK
jgi:hypothetical protein